MPKTRRGGKSTPYVRPRNIVPPPQQAAPTPPPQQAAPPQQPTDQQNQPVNQTLAQFRAMTPDQQADFISQMVQTPVPVFLANNDFQRLLYGMKLNDKPQIASDAQLDSMPGTDMFRAVNANNDTINRIRYTAPDVANQIIRGSVTRVSDSGGSVHGRGIYLANSYSSARVYGDYVGNLQKTAMIRAKYLPTAKIVSESAILGQLTKEIRSGSKLGRVLGNMYVKDAQSVLALARGYDAVSDPLSGYNVILNRSVLIASDRVKQMGNTW